jgi:hypothetical protein
MAIVPQEKAGVDARCEFHFTYRMRDIVPMLRRGFEGDGEAYREAIAQLDARDRELEDHLINRPCCECLDDGSS